MTKTAAKFARNDKKSSAKSAKMNGHSRPAKRSIENDFLGDEGFEAEVIRAAVAVEADVDDELEAELEVEPDWKLRRSLSPETTTRSMIRSASI